MSPAINSSASLSNASQAVQPTPINAVGCFKLQPRHALTLTIKTPGELRIAHGQVWVTFADASQDTSSRAGDHFLQAGGLLKLDCGQQVVMEAFQMQSEAAVYFSWVPNAALQRPASPQRLQNAPADVRQAWLDLGAALHQGLWALGRLLKGVSRNLVCTLMPGRSF